ncbi:MAG: 4-phosphoerythronate dehydrogenase [Paramuribaculum sp.]|nr:4-phosphoerythronate dehydrogenase [Paramuribaculum sp.]
MGVKIVIEKNVPYLEGVWPEGVTVVRKAAADITPEVMRDADALITRTRTRCDASLLQDSVCRFIGTATIGTDHIDLPYCQSRGIEVVNAPGCNAPAVAQYVMAAVLDRFPDPTGKTIGIVGVGHVGRIVEKWARSIGMNVLLCDPPRAEREGAEGFTSPEHIARDADVITFHTPLTDAPLPYHTRRLCDRALVERMQRSPLVINAARGGVTDTEALLYGLRNNLIGDVAIDCWEGEPEINRELLSMAHIATPHIAGYSLQGKERASATVAQALCRHFGLQAPNLHFTPPAAAPDTVTPEDITSSYDPLADTTDLKTSPEHFEALRNGYNLRNEPKV